MAYPTTIDDFTNPASGDPLNSPSHSTQHININNAVEALEAKVGADSSAVTTSHDYKIAQLESTRELTTNKETSALDTSTTKYPCNNVVKTAVDAKQDALVSGTNIKTINSTSVLGSGNIAVEPTISAGTSSQYWRGDKSWQTLNATAVGLGNVDNTSDATKNSATATLTNKRITKRISATTSVASITPDISSYDVYELTAQDANFTLNLPSVDEAGQTIVVRILTSSAKTLTIDAGYKAENTLPTALASGKRYEFIINQFNTGASKEYWITGIEF